MRHKKAAKAAAAGAAKLNVVAGGAPGGAGGAGSWELGALANVFPGRTFQINISVFQHFAFRISVCVFLCRREAGGESTNEKHQKWKNTAEQNQWKIILKSQQKCVCVCVRLLPRPLLTDVCLELIGSRN